MQPKLLASILIALPLSLSALAQGGGGSDPVGSLPRPVAKDKGPCSGTTIVKPGGSALNNDGMMVTTDADSAGSCSLTPGKSMGAAGCSSKGNAKAGWKGSINGQDSNDTVSVNGPTMPGSTVAVTGTGGTVNIGPSCSVHVVNAGGTGATSTTVNTPTGTTVLAPGQSQVFHT
jgi:hypothetical protein